MRNDQPHLRVLIELVPDFEEVVVARQVPEIHSALLPVDRVGFHSVVDADGGDVLGHEPVLTEPLDET